MVPDYIPVLYFFHFLNYFFQVFLDKILKTELKIQGEPLI